jgi:hypothetical protein
MTTFTPGPWRVIDREVMEDGSVYPCHILGGTADYQVCTLESPEIAKRGHAQPDLFPGLNGVLGPNAALIAAAPDLLEALAALLGCIDHGSDNPTLKLDAARAAIRKARGSQ